MQLTCVGGAHPRRDCCSIGFVFRVGRHCHGVERYHFVKITSIAVGRETSSEQPKNEEQQEQPILISFPLRKQDFSSAVLRAL